jgi:hypothetical protein
VATPSVRPSLPSSLVNTGEERDYLFPGKTSEKGYKDYELQITVNLKLKFSAWIE